MNICILVKSTLAHQMGGIQIHVKTLSEQASQLGHNITIITTRHPAGVEHESEANISFYYLKNAHPGRYSKSWWQESAKKIIQLHSQNKFDVIWSESLAGSYYAKYLRKELRIPIISVDQGNAFISVIKNRWYSIASFKDFILFMVRYLPESLFFDLPLFNKTFKLSDMIVAVSNQTAHSIQRQFCIHPNKIRVIYNSVDINTFKPDDAKRENTKRKFSISNDDRVILMAGVVHRQKGMHIGLKVFAKIKKEIPNCRMMILGDGPYLGALKKLAKDLKIKNDVIFCGHISNQSMPFYYNAADVLLNPTLREEGLPIVVAEAMACGLGVVTSRIGGTESTIEEAISGFFIKPKDEIMMIKRLNEILTNQELRKKIGTNARAKATSLFNKEKMAAQYLDLSEKLITQYQNKQ